jgi:hypothetical protein
MATLATAKGIDVLTIPFVGGSYTARSKFFDAQRTVNLFPEVSRTGRSKSIAALYGTPGKRLYLTIPGGGGIRGMLKFNASMAVIVAGAGVYLLTGSVFVLVGNITNDTTPVRMASNGQIVMNPSTPKLEEIVNPAFAGADAVDFLDGRFVFNRPGTGQFQITGLYTGSIDALDFATAEGSPDALVTLLVDHRELWLFGEDSTEVFFDSGNPDFPFERIQGAFIEHGCAAKYSAAGLENSVYWLSSDLRGGRTILRAQGYQPQKVSTTAIDYAISQYDRVDDAVAWVYQQEGHSFYVLNFPSANVTWAYDVTTDEWHERAWRNPATTTINRDRAQCHMFFGGRHLVGDWQDGRIYALDLDYYLDDTDLIAAIRQTPHQAVGNSQQFFHKIWLDMEVGVGLNGAVYGSNPEAVLDWSDDGGISFGHQVSAPLGKLGERLTRVNFRRLGTARDRVWRVTIVDPVKRAFIASGVDVTEGIS